MSRREITLVIAGLIVGLLLGVVVGRTRIAGNLLSGAATSLQPMPAFYLVDLSTAAQWIQDSDSEASPELDAVVSTVVSLPSSPDFGEGFKAASEAVDTLLLRFQGALSGADASAPDAPKICLGLDNDPYQLEGPTLYVYIQVPAGQSERIPAEWEPLEQPKDNDLFWQLLRCYPIPQEQS